MPDFVPEATATPILKSVETINGTTDLTADDLNPNQVFADAEQANIEKCFAVSEEKSAAIFRRTENDELNQSAMQAAEMRNALENNGAKIQVELTAAQL